ncbi:hypothetical protein EIM02_26125, partial [Pseudomonas aeruginosa]
MKGTVHPRRLLLCLVLVPALLAGLGAWQSWRAEQQAERLGAYAVFDMDNTSYRYDLEESLLPYL